MSLEDVFILYMDLASEAGVEAEAKFQMDMEEGNGGFSSMANSSNKKTASDDAGAVFLLQ